MIAEPERVLVAVARSMALVLTGSERGTTWFIDDAPGDGFWVVTAPINETTTRWTRWERPTDEELLAYQRFVCDLGI